MDTQKRELKFRAWNGEEMISPDRIDRYGVAWWSENSIPTSSNKVMQFTGLFDVLEKEIYEGDIVRFDDRIDSFGVVVFEHDSFKAKMPKFGIYWKLAGKNQSKSHRVSIIGNIHANPGLL